MKLHLLESHEILTFYRAERRTNEESNKRTKSEPTNSSSSTSSSSKRQSSSSERRKNGADEEVRRKKKRDGNNDKSKGKTENMTSNRLNLNPPLILFYPLSYHFPSFPHAAFGFGFCKCEEVTGLGPRNSVDKLSEDEELEVSLTEDAEIVISRNRNNSNVDDSLENSSTTPDKSLTASQHSSGLSKNDGDDEEELGLFQRGAGGNSSFSRRSSLRTAVRDKRSSRRNYSTKKANKVSMDQERQIEPKQGTSAQQQKCTDPSPYSSLSSVSIMSATAPVAHPKATDALPATVRPEDLRLNLNSLDSSSACSDFKSMEGNSLEILEATHL